MKLIRYNIKYIIVDRPVVDLPKGSQVVSVTHRDAFEFAKTGIKVPECWRIVYLEPVEEVVQD